VSQIRWPGVDGVPREGGAFSAAKPEPNCPWQTTKIWADQQAKEQQACALIHQGKLEQAEAIFHDLVATGSSQATVYGNLGAICGARRKYDEAIGHLNKALEIKPDYPEAHVNLGVALQNQGNFTAAIAAFNSALAYKPNDASAYTNLGTTLRLQGDQAAAITAFNTALSLRPNAANAHIGLGIALQEQGDRSAAITAFRKAIALQPDHPDAYNNLAIALQENGDLPSAIAAYGKALAIKPDNAQAYSNLGNALQEQGDLAAAITAYNKSIELTPSYQDAYYNRAIALQAQGHLAAAIASCKQALELKPDFFDAHNRLGLALCEQGDFPAAIASYQKALEIRPDYREAHWNLALITLLLGDYKFGWEEYQWRFRFEDSPSQPHAAPQCTVWNGEAPAEGKNKLLLVSEQGLGDTLQFMRYTIALREQGFDVSLCAPIKLHSLIKASGLAMEPLTPQQADQVKEGGWIPLLSLPWHLGVSPTNPILTKPYIKTTDALTAKWKRLLSLEQRPIIGLHWQGNPNAEVQELRGRSLCLDAFAPIAAQGPASLVSLQKGFGSEQLETCSFQDRFVPCQDQINDTWDFLESAAIIANCDLVITNDTAVAHLAGGMGKTTWLLLHKVPDWRWGLESETSFWYPSMRLFRQKEAGDWDEVMERVAKELDPFLRFSIRPQSPAAVASPAASKQALQSILAPISLGELIDKISILHLKAQHFVGPSLENANMELKALEAIFNSLPFTMEPRPIQRLDDVNKVIWQLEDCIREQERQKEFGDTYVEVARSIQQQKDLRAAIKKEIDTTYGFAFVEEKVYQTD
jgi:tetratricopeptide (TPR) repeat protein